MLEGTLDFYGVPGYFTSSTTATIAIYNPGAFQTLPARQYSGGIVVSSCLLNGPFDSSHYYMEWDSPGFDVSLYTIINLSSILDLFGRTFTERHLTYWVDLNNLGLSPSSTSLPNIVQVAESYLHTELSRYYILPEMIGAVPIDSSNLKVTADTRYNKATKKSTVTITVTNVSSNTFEGPIQVLLKGFPSIPVITPAPPVFPSLLAGVLGDPYFTAPVSTLSPGATVTISFQYLGPPQQLNYTHQVYSGTFLY